MIVVADGTFKFYNYTMGSLMVMAKEGDVEEFDKIQPKLNTIKGVLDDNNDYETIEIDTPFLTTKKAGDIETNDDQKKFQGAC